MPAPHHAIFTGRMLFLTPNQQFQSTEGKFHKIPPINFSVILAKQTSKQTNKQASNKQTNN